MEVAAQVDFFVSYNHADRAWAEWIAWELECAGRSVIVEAWDFRPGGNWAALMDDACRQARRIVLVLSPNFLSSTYTRPEWGSYFALDPTGAQHLMVPVLVDHCAPDGLLRALVDIKLVGCTEQQARERLLAGIDGERAKPVGRPVFPGDAPPFPGGRVDVRPTGAPAGPAGPAVPVDAAPAPAQLSWSDVESCDIPIVTWRADMPGQNEASWSCVEVHVVRFGPPRVPSAADWLGTANWLVALGRACGLFAGERSVDVLNDGRTMVATAAERPAGPSAGMAVTSTGQLSAWSEPPAPTATGSRARVVLDHVEKLLHLLAQIDHPDLVRVGFAVRLSPEGCCLLPDRHVVDTALVTAHHTIAGELVSRLLSRPVDG